MISTVLFFFARVDKLHSLTDHEGVQCSKVCLLTTISFPYIVMVPHTPIIVNKYRYVERYELFGQDNWEQNKPSGPSTDVADEICKDFLCWHVGWRGRTIETFDNHWRRLSLSPTQLIKAEVWERFYRDPWAYRSCVILQQLSKCQSRHLITTRVRLRYTFLIGSCFIVARIYLFPANKLCFHEP